MLLAVCRGAAVAGQLLGLSFLHSRLESTYSHNSQSHCSEYLWAFALACDLVYMDCRCGLLPASDLSRP